ncbi:MAG: Macrolide export protein MacA [Planctomycetes bacterium]|nr:Macrolide export protein MacA [Planctomycetota bacterium]
MRICRPTLCAAVLLAATSLAACSKGGGDAPPAARPPEPAPPKPAAGDTRSRVAVRRGDVSEIASAIGSFSARRTSRVGPQVSGRLAEVLVDVGDAVKSGQELARVDRMLFAIEVDQAKAAVATAEARAAAIEPAITTADADARAFDAQLKDAQANLERMRSLWERPESGTPSIPKSRFDEAGFRVDQVTASLQAARSRATEVKAQLMEERAKVAEEKEGLRHAEQRLAETVVRAPFDGVVTQRLVDPGEPVTSAPVTHLLEVQETSTLELVFALPQALLATTRAGSPVTFEVEGVEGPPGTAAIETIFPAMEEATRSFRCRALVPNPDGRYRPGLLAQVRVEVRRAKGALVVPPGALQRTSRGWQVVVDAAGREESRAVEVGIVTDEAAEIRSGLAEGDSVVVASGAKR